MDKKLYIAPGVHICGDVQLGHNCNIWYGAVLRGDCGKISVGEGTDIQDNAVIHDETQIGEYCVIGHSAVVHGCTVGNCCLIGMGSVVLNGAVIGEGSVIGAGAVVLRDTVIPPYSLAVGNPAHIVKRGVHSQYFETRRSAEDYIERAAKAESADWL